MKNMIRLAMLVWILTLIGCGKNEGEIRVIQDRITCSDINHNLCSSESMSCRRVDYYSSQWDCTVVVVEE